MIPSDTHIDVEPPAADLSEPSTSSEPAAVSLPPSQRSGMAIAAGLILGLILAAWTLLSAQELREIAFRVIPAPVVDSDPYRSLAALQAATHQAEIRVSRLSAKMRSYLPRSPYLIVSTSDNHFELYAKGGLVREGICSTGSYVQLQGSDNQQWMFQTPRGAFRIQEKRVNPVWAKPDWAFVEEGLPVPPQGAPERFERGVLGDYALAIGNGYLIHGTLYQRMLGQPVTHGCVRLGDEDLEAVFHKLALGARVYIY